MTSAPTVAAMYRKGGDSIPMRVDKITATIKNKLYFLTFFGFKDSPSFPEYSPASSCGYGNSDVLCCVR